MSIPQPTSNLAYLFLFLFFEIESHHTGQAYPEPVNFHDCPGSASQVLGSQACAPLPIWTYFIYPNSLFRSLILKATSEEMEWIELLCHFECGLIPKPNVLVLIMSNKILISFYYKMSFKLMFILVWRQSKFIVILRMS